MNLPDSDILELTELCNGAIEGRLSAAQTARLEQRLQAEEEARRFYVRFMSLSASLCQRAAELQTEAPERDAEPANVIRPKIWRWTAFGAIAAAAAVVLLVWLIDFPKRESAVTEATSEEVVARLTGIKDCRWAHKIAALQPGEELHSRQRLELKSGYAEITFDSGAQVVLEGPGTLEISSAWEATLLAGTLKAIVPAEAIGFRVMHPSVTVVDLGTEFSMIADPGGSAEVFVLKGSVQAERREDALLKPVVLHAQEACRFASDRITEVRDRDLKFARLTRKVAFDRIPQTRRFLHWAFEAWDGMTSRPESFGMSPGACEVSLVAPQPLEQSQYLVTGPWGQALHFDGQLTARVGYPGMATNFPQTIAFWIRIPEGSPLSDAGAIIAWESLNRKSNSVPVQISWNANPAQGVLGALRTDIFRGYQVGTTPLRDGRWHHVAVLFLPNKHANLAWHIKQYVDGRLEGASARTPIKRRLAVAGAELATDQNILWLGARLGRGDKIKERFHGDLDELYLGGHPLIPQEIKTLISANRLPSLETILF